MTRCKRVAAVVGLCVIVAAVTVPVIAAAFEAEKLTIVGTAAVTDGDTIKIDDHKIRLHGIDAPEIGQVCQVDGGDWKAGEDAKRALASFVRGRLVVCSDTGKRTYGRVVATCRVRGIDLGDMLVRSGWAFDAPKYSAGRYAEAEAAAAAAGIGIHRGQCQRPAEYRREKRGG